MFDSETDGWCVSHDLREDRSTQGTSDTGKPVRRTGSKTCSTQQDTDKSKDKSKISVILTDKPKSSMDIPLRIALSGQAQRRVDDPSSSLPNDTDKNKQKRFVGDRGRTSEAMRRHI